MLLSVMILSPGRSLKIPECQECYTAARHGQTALVFSLIASAQQPNLEESDPDPEQFLDPKDDPACW
ncbi:MAG: hypothetical protein IPM01_03560 [Burkholderiaceae bacterium]|nr:hypothetical protein [Burkholderiaceae bacterium]